MCISYFQNRWTFKLRVTVARACVSSARSIKLVNDIELVQGEAGVAPLLVVGSGRAFAVPEQAHKKAIMGVVQKVRFFFVRSTYLLIRVIFLYINISVESGNVGGLYLDCFFYNRTRFRLLLCSLHIQCFICSHFPNYE